ncbi:hypothetical protein KM043_011175 [Ampulex compressa]|nr:hypothetical protein KM043_011175 [Ampulex compressa]
MRTTASSSSIVFLILLLFVSYSSCIDGKFSSEDFDKKLNGLWKVVDYVHRRLRQMNVDTTFGITLAEANIIATLMHNNARYLSDERLAILREVLVLCDSTRRRLIGAVVPENKNVQLLLNNPGIWINRIKWKRGGFRKKLRSTPDLTYRNVVNLTMQGAPRGNESDLCLAKIIQSKLNGECRLPSMCVAILTEDDDARGYPLTHRLLILQVAKALKCQRTANVDTKKMILSICADILQDLVDVEAADYPYNSRDLMMEQVVLCGMEGFLEFINLHYERLILDWPHPSGCFSSTGFRGNPGVPSRRSSLKTDFGCDSHTTGLGAASLSLYIRENVENAFE